MVAKLDNEHIEGSWDEILKRPVLRKWRGRGLVKTR